ncbi:hypothetical protein AgCh_022102 [Apium graveolens]
MKADAIGAIFKNQSFQTKEVSSRGHYKYPNFRSITMRRVKGAHDFINLEFVNDEVLRKVFCGPCSPLPSRLTSHQLPRGQGSSIRESGQDPGTNRVIIGARKRGRTSDVTHPVAPLLPFPIICSEKMATRKSKTSISGTIQPTVIPPRDGEMEEIEEEPPITRVSSLLQPGDQRVTIEKAAHKYGETSTNPWGNMTPEQIQAAMDLWKEKTRLLKPVPGPGGAL